MNPLIAAILSPLWLILFVLALLVLILLFGSAKVRIISRESLTVILYICGIPITLVSEKKKEKKKKRETPTEFSECHNPDAVLKKEKKKLLAAKKKEEKKKRKAEAKAAKKDKHKSEHTPKPKAPPAPKPNIKENLSMITALLKKLYAVTNGKFRLRVYRMHILIGTDDAAKTAILYGSVLQSATYLFQWLQTHFIPIRRKKGSMRIEPDFVNGKISADIDLCCSIKFRRAIAIGVKMLLAFLTEKKKVDQKVALRVAKAAQAEAVQKQETNTIPTI
jgi:hypothetical protein